MRPGAHSPRLDRVPPAPRAPSARALRLAGGPGRAILALVGGMLLVLGGVVSAVFCWGLPQDVAIDLGSARTRGTVLASSLDLSTTVLDRHPARVRYAYEAGGARLTAEHDALVDPPAPGAPVEIEYATANPAWSRLAGERRALLGRWSFLLLLLPLSGLAMVLAAARARRRDRRALVHGRPALARVTFRGLDASVRVGRANPTVIRWELRTPAGEVVRGQASALDPALLADHAGADEVVVLYDPADPRVSVLWVE